MHCVWLTNYPDSSPSTTTDKAKANPKAEAIAIAIERRANSICRPLSKYQDDTPKTNTEAVT